MQSGDTARKINREIEAIDVHGHYGTALSSASAVRNEITSGDAQTVLQRAASANIAFTVVSPLAGLFPRAHGAPVSANEDAAQVVATHEGLGYWVILDPLRSETFEQARRLLASPKCVGIKIHPEEHCYCIREHGQVIFEFAAAQRSVVMTHSGEQNSLPEDYLPFADAFPEVTLILAHLGCGYDGDPTHQVRAIQQSRHGNVFVDLSSACNVQSGLIEWAVQQIGAEKMLFGTDSPLHDARFELGKIVTADISETAKRKILGLNAIKLLEL